MKSINEFLLANPVGVALLAIVAAAVWDIAKKGSGFFFDPKKSASKEAYFIADAIDRFENGSFIVAIARDAVNCSFGAITILGMNILTVLSYVTDDADAPQMLFVRWGVTAMFFMAIIIFIHSANRLFKWYRVICHPRAAIAQLSRRITKLPPEDSAPLRALLLEASAKALDLKLDLSKGKPLT